MLPVVTAFQDIMVRGQAPNIASMLPVTLLAIASMATGFIVFRRAAPEMVDVL